MSSKQFDCLGNPLEFAFSHLEIDDVDDVRCKHCLNARRTSKDRESPLCCCASNNVTRDRPHFVATIVNPDGACSRGVWNFQGFLLNWDEIKDLWTDSLTEDVLWDRMVARLPG
jgi:hypothetical protein